MDSGIAHPPFLNTPKSCLLPSSLHAGSLQEMSLITPATAFKSGAPEGDYDMSDLELVKIMVQGRRWMVTRGISQVDR